MHIDTQNRKEITTAIRRRYRTRFKLSLRFHTCRVIVYSNHEALHHALAHYYRSFLTDTDSADIRLTVIEAPVPSFSFPFAVKPPDPGKTRIKEEYAEITGGRVVRKRK